MTRNLLVVALLLVICGLRAADAKGTPVDWYDFYPTWAHTTGGEEITVVGCGFRTYSEVVCLWNKLWPSATSVILDDNTIICETPRGLTHQDFTTLPQFVTFELLFDGVYGPGSATLDLSPFRFGPAFFSFSPTTGFIGGGGTITLSGEGFNEFSSIQVYFDDVVTAGTASSDTTITATIPPGDFNQNALIDIYFENNPQFYLHNDDTYHYGPIIEGFNPTCGHFAFGGDTFTIVGQNFNDPLLTSSAPNVSFIGYSTTPTIRSVLGSIQGNGIVVTAPLGAWLLGVTVQVAFENRDDQIYRFEAAQYIYGPDVYDVEPDVGFVGGGSIVTVFGCGFNNYTNTQIAVDIGGSACTGVTIASNGLSLTCTYPAGTCNTDQDVDVTFTTVDTPPDHTITLSNAFHYGPVVDDGSITPSRGPAAGGGLVTITGIRFRQTANTNFASPSCTFGSNPGTSFNTISETMITCGIPPGIFNTDVIVTINFAVGCTQAQEYHYGPICTGFNPTYGYIGGGVPVTLQGVGLNEQTVVAVTFCNLLDGSDCNQINSDHLATVGGATFSTISVNTPVVVSPGNRGAPFKNRYFGDDAEVKIYYNTTSVPIQVIQCPFTYRYGPIVSDITPHKAPMGPTYVDPATSFTATGIQVQGGGFNDPLINTDPLVAFETVRAAAETITSDSALTLNTLWGGESNTFHNVTVFFDICNSTTTVDPSYIHWGPMITDVTPIWGIKPWGSTLLTIIGNGFDEYDNIDGVDQARCIIDGLVSNETRIEFDSNVNGLVIHCFAPPNVFGTNATVIVEFGETCLNEVTDYTKTILADARVYYRPTITAISPTFGYTSGGKNVQVFGVGFDGWDENPEGTGAYTCFFDHFKAASTTFVGDTEVDCVTPGPAEIDVRQYFNTDVRVHVQLNGTSLTNEDWKVWYDSYHYGPICTGFTPSRSDLPGGDPITVQGSGFQDTDTFTNITVRFNNIIVSIQAASSIPGDTQLNTWTNPDGQCATDYPITLVFDSLNAANPIFCGDFVYGPTYADQISKYGGNYGWDGEPFTITGTDFLDNDLTPNSTFAHVLFGNVDAGAIISLTDNSAEVTVPRQPGNQWQAEVTVSMRWSGFNKTCTITGDFFHYGPEVTAINPTNGYVAGGDQVTIIGVALDCCRLQSGGPNNDTQCVFDNIAFPSNQTTVSPNAVTGCTVPLNNQIGRLMQNVGLQFNTTTFGSQLRLTPLTYYYGPNVTGSTPEFGPLKGGDAGLVTLVGINLDDPWFYSGPSQQQCVFAPADGAPTNISNSESVSRTAVTCKSPEYSRQCGDFDYVGLRYNRTDNNAFYFLPGGSGGLQNVFTYYYGSVITSVTTSTGEMRSNTTGGLIVTLSGNWIDFQENRADHRTARCVFGHFIQDDDVPIQGTAPNNFVVCTVPEGPFNWDGEIAVILDPHWDDETELSSYGNYTSAWHWIPYTTDLSRTYQPEDQTYTVVALGGGFCNYDNVICYFAGSTEGVQSDITDDLKVTCQTPPLGFQTTSITLQFCDRNNPDGITDEEQCACDYLGTPDQSTVPTSFTYVGFGTQITPTNGPMYGNTVVTLTGIGFSNYILSGAGQPEVYFYGVNTYTGTYGSATSNSSSGDSFLVITTPDVSGDGPQIAVIEIVFTRKEPSVSYARKESFFVPAFFDFGVPEVTQITPAGPFDYDAGDTITLSGIYFNGGTNYFCQFAPQDDPANITTVPGTNSSPADNQGNEIICSVPTNLPYVGLYYVQASVSNSATNPPAASFSSDDVAISVTQDGTITSINPTTGSEFGGTTVTVTGNSFNGASAPYLCRFGTKIVGGTFTPGTKKREAESESRRSLFHTFEVDSVFGTGDRITCRSPAEDPSTVDVTVSIDGGITWFTGTNNKFTFVKGGAPADDTTGTTGSTGVRTKSAAASLHFSQLAVALVTLLSALLYALM